MSLKDGKDYLFLIWKSEQSGKQYIVGQLTKNNEYEFKYCEEIEEALEDGFVPLLCFPDLGKVYRDERMFSIFSSRLPDKKRKDIGDILKKYGMEKYDEYMLLKRSGARLPIDGLEFVDPILDTDKNQTRIFFAEGVKDYINTWEITRGDEVFSKEMWKMNIMKMRCK